MSGALPGSRRRAWGAFFLNVFAPPAGYLFAGAPRAAALLASGLCGLMLFVFVRSLTAPPGFYGWPTGAAEEMLWTLSLVFGAHAAFLAARIVPRRRWPQRLGAAVAVCAALAIGLLAVRTFAPVSVYRVASTSMEPTLRVGEKIAVLGARGFCRGARPGRGEVALVRRRGGGGAWLRRVTGLPGETVSTLGGIAVVNGRALAGRVVGAARVMRESGPRLEPLVEEADAGRIWRVAAGPVSAVPDGAPIRLASDQIYVLGDDRGDALDSRMAGPVELRDVCGVVTKILWSPDRSRIGARP